MKKFILSLILVGSVLVFFSCQTTSEPTQPEPADDIADNPETTDDADFEEIDITTDEEIALESAGDINTKFTDEFKAGTLKALEESAISLGLIYTRDESGKGDESYAFSFADMILECLSQISGKCFKIVSTDETREKLLETSGQLLDSAFDSSQAFEELGKQIPVNFGFFVEVKPAVGMEKVCLKIYIVQTGELFFGKSYTFKSDYLNYVEEAKVAEEKGDIEQAATLLEQASAERGGKDPNLEKRKEIIVKKLPKNKQQALQEFRTISSKIKRIHAEIKSELKQKKLRKQRIMENRDFLQDVLKNLWKLRKALGLSAKKGLDELQQLIEADIDACNRLIGMAKKGVKPTKNFKFRTKKPLKPHAR